jgi:peroxiredoxin
LIQFEEQMGVTFPILYDQDIQMQLEFYKLEVIISSPYPKDWIIGVDGVIRYVNNKFDSQEMLSIIEEELEKMHAAKAARAGSEP